VAVVFRRRITHFGLLVPVLIGLGLALGIGFLPTVADHVGYALPWQMPKRMLYSGRDYLAHSRACKPRSEFHPLRRRGWMLGYFAPSRRRYLIGTKDNGSDPTLVVVEGSRRDCLIVYSLQGGP
jgi:hypothetical protein